MAVGMHSWPAGHGVSQLWLCCTAGSLQHRRSKGCGVQQEVPPAGWHTSPWLAGGSCGSLRCFPRPACAVVLVWSWTPAACLLWAVCKQDTLLCSPCPSPAAVLTGIPFPPDRTPVGCGLCQLCCSESCPSPLQVFHPLAPFPSPARADV